MSSLPLKNSGLAEETNAFSGERFHPLRPTFNLLVVAILCFAGTCQQTIDAASLPVRTMRLNVGTQVIVVHRSSEAVSGTPIVIPVGLTPWTVEFLDSSDEVVTGLEPSFHLEFESADGNIVTIHTTGLGEGGFFGVNEGQTTVNFSLCDRPPSTGDCFRQAKTCVIHEDLAVTVLQPASNSNRTKS